METGVVCEPVWRDLEAQGGRARGETGGTLVYTVGDIHGCYDLLTALLAQIAEDAERRAQGRKPVLILCGDYVDRGPRSAQVLEAVASLRRQTDFAVYPLKGNHEQALLDFIDDPGTGAGWLRYGAIETLGSYGIGSPDPADPSSLVRARDELLARMPASHLQLLRSLEMMVEVGDYVFVHAGIRPRVPLDDQTADDLLWIRRDFLNYEGPHPKIVVHGHSWVDEHPQAGEYRIGVDTGAYSTDMLTALRLDGAEAAYLQIDASAL